jgi:hypothetical protein
MGKQFSGDYPAGIVLTNLTATNPATIAAGSHVTGSSDKHGGDAVYGAVDPWTITNAGTLAGKSKTGNGIELMAGGRVTNAATGYVAGSQFGIAIRASRGSVVNKGTISAGSTGVVLYAGGTVRNTPSGNISGAIDRYYVAGATISRFERAET